MDVALRFLSLLHKLMESNFTLLGLFFLTKNNFLINDYASRFGFLTFCINWLDTQLQQWGQSFFFLNHFL